MFPQAGACEIEVNQCSILGTPGPDTLLGGPAADLICGLGGDDTIDGGGGDDTLIGGPGDDHLTGGNGDDCLLGGTGRDRLPGFDPNEDLERTQNPVAGQPTAPDVEVVDRRGRCRTKGKAGEVPAGGADERVAGGGARELRFAVAGGVEQGTVDTPVRAGSLIVSIARLLDQQEQQQTTGFPVTLVPYGRAKDGVARLLVQCPEASHSGTLVLERRVGGRRQRAGRVRFTCSPPSVLVRVTVAPAVRRLLADRGSVRLTVRIIVDGLEREGNARLTLRPDAG